MNPKRLFLISPAALLAFSLASFATVFPCRAVEAPQFQSGDRWCVLGDSITHSGSYHRYVELFYLTRFPARQLEVINCGVSGDTVPGALKRLHWDCLDAKPTVVSVMLGMNDVGRNLYRPGDVTADLEKQRTARAETYDKTMRKLTESLLASGAKVVLIKPSIFDDTADLQRENNPGCGAALAGFGKRVQAIADDFKVATLDFNTPMAAINAEQQKSDPKFTIVGADRVHPTAPGHLVMAFEFLHAQKPSGIVSRITVDAPSGKAGRLENCEVTDLKADTSGVSFTCLERALPFPVEESAKPALAFVPFTLEFNQEILLVRGLKPGDYELVIDGKTIRSFCSAQLADGVNLADEPNTPQRQQALEVLAALQEKWEAVSKLRTIAYCEHQSWPDAPRPVDFEQMSAKLEARLAKTTGTSNPWIVTQMKTYLEVKPGEAKLRGKIAEVLAKVYRLNQPRPHHFVITAAVSKPETTEPARDREKQTPAGAIQ